eukprot:TRINITY_DN5777_c0_g1_i1.p1 TRINITY_DN5777_c0_g1~~TRINITY_DN5777_c0_g1_i1.p1  ORF type:complete len:149 (-),score=29.47 TRINITY_DN5777_c0_g1_i1:916-1362(-)
MAKSSLNPNAPLFFPASYLNTVDFSPEWYQLVQKSPAFGEYWLSENFEWDMSDDFEDVLSMETMDDIGMVSSEESDWAASLPCEFLGGSSGGSKLPSSTDVALLLNGVDREQRHGTSDPVRGFDKVPKKAASSMRKQGIARINQPRAT